MGAGRAPDPSGKGNTQGSITVITPGYFAAMSLRLRPGRDFTDADIESTPHVAIVSAAFARQYWPQENPIGKQFRRGTPEDKEPTPWLTVVGIVPETLKGEFDSKIWPQAYTCYLQAPGGDAAHDGLRPRARRRPGRHDPDPVECRARAERRPADLLCADTHQDGGRGEIH